uniref:S-adenosylmethionine-dependent methyltransferase n=1 Tax=Rhizophora mucronata TaxID=61149 RepID=A0A2P2M3K4_RHIMU
MERNECPRRTNVLEDSCQKGSNSYLGQASNK